MLFQYIRREREKVIICRINYRAWSYFLGGVLLLPYGRGFIEKWILKTRTTRKEGEKLIPFSNIFLYLHFGSSTTGGIWKNLAFLNEPVNKWKILSFYIVKEFLYVSICSKILYVISVANSACKDLACFVNFYLFYNHIQHLLNLDK